MAKRTVCEFQSSDIRSPLSRHEISTCLVSSWKAIVRISCAPFMSSSTFALGWLALKSSMASLVHFLSIRASALEPGCQDGNTVLHQFLFPSS